MARKLTVTIDSILNGQQTTENIPGTGQFNFSRGIDPDVSTDQASTSPKSSGMITQVRYSSFSGANVNSAPIATLTNPKNTLVYSVLANGRLISYSSVLGSETLIGTVTGNEAHGAFYYNNYIYITGTGSSHDDVSRYGPLDGTPALTNGVWTGSTLGTQTALTDTTYPSKRSVEYPSHWGHVHSDGQAYFFDFKNGQGMIHSIKTSKTTVEGDTDNGSAYNVLDLPFGYLPTDIESYGTDVIISAIQTTNATLSQGPSALFLWDPTDTDSFYRQIDLAEFPLVTALQNKSGRVYVFSGNQNNGNAVGVYDGAYGVDPIEFFADGRAPFAGAVSTYGNRIAWGTEASQVSDEAVVMSLGYKSPRLSRSAIHTIGMASTSGSLPVISSLVYAQQASGIVPRVLIGARDSSAFTIDKIGGSDGANPLIEWGQFIVGEPFKITEVRVPVTTQVGSANITPLFLFDNGQDSYALKTINSTNFSGKRNIVYKTPELTDTTGGIQAQGQNSFMFRLTYNDSDSTSVIFPIKIDLETIDE